jgi:hypothetical protein
MVKHAGVVAAIEEVNRIIKERRGRSARGGNAGWGSMNELACVLTLVEQGWDVAFSTSNLQSGFLTTGSVGDVESRFAEASFDQYVRQIVDTGGRDPILAQEMIVARAAKDALLPEGLARGELRDAEFFAHGIQPDAVLKEGDKPRDEMPRQRRRGEILNKAMVLTKHALFHVKLAALLKAQVARIAGAAAAKDAAAAAELACDAAKVSHADAKEERKRLDVVRKRKRDDEREAKKMQEKDEVRDLAAKKQKLSAEVLKLESDVEMALGKKEVEWFEIVHDAKAMRDQLHRNALALKQRAGRGAASPSCEECGVRVDHWLAEQAKFERSRAKVGKRARSMMLNLQLPLLKWLSKKKRKRQHVVCPCCQE